MQGTGQSGSVGYQPKAPAPATTVFSSAMEPLSARDNATGEYMLAMMEGLSSPERSVGMGKTEDWAASDNSGGVRHG